MEECVLSTEQIRNSAALLDAVIELLIEVCALDMGLKSNFAAVTDAQIKLRKEDSVRVCRKHFVDPAEPSSDFGS